MKNKNRDILFSTMGFNNQTCVDTENPFFWSYVAGIMDTEGSFTIRKEKPHSGSISKRYNPIIQLTMVPSECINYIRENFSGGSFCVPKAKSVGKGYAFKMNISARDDCRKFLGNILPYLKFKKEQASLILKFCEENIIIKNCRAGVPSHVLEFREELYQKMRQLNK